MLLWLTGNGTSFSYSMILLKQRIGETNHGNTRTSSTRLVGGPAELGTLSFSGFQGFSGFHPGSEVFLHQELQ